MQTFLPYSSFYQSAKCLDNKRLGKQRVECLQILKALNDSSYGWQNHPAVKMWRGYEQALGEYGVAICEEWISRGFKDTCKDKITELVNEAIPTYYPNFIGNEEFHNSHKSKLLNKKPEHYSQFGWQVPNNLEYVWSII
jgi:hypothetical protein